MVQNRGHTVTQAALDPPGHSPGADIVPDGSGEHRSVFEDEPWTSVATSNHLLRQVALGSITILLYQSILLRVWPWKASVLNVADTACSHLETTETGDGRDDSESNRPRKPIVGWNHWLSDYIM